MIESNKLTEKTTYTHITSTVMVDSWKNRAGHSRERDDDDEKERNKRTKIKKKPIKSVLPLIFFISFFVNFGRRSPKISV